VSPFNLPVAVRDELVDRLAALQDDRGRYVDPFRLMRTMPDGRRLIYDTTHPDLMYASQWSAELADPPACYSFPVPLGFQSEIPWNKDLQWQVGPSTPSPTRDEQILCTLRPMSHLRFLSRAVLSQECATSQRDKVADAAATVELHAAHFVAQTNTSSAPLFPFHDPPSQTRFRNGEIVSRLIFPELID